MTQARTPVLDTLNVVISSCHFGHNKKQGCSSVVRMERGGVEGTIVQEVRRAFAEQLQGDTLQFRQL